MSASIDTLIFPRWIIPVEPANVCLENHFIGIDQGKIVALGPKADAAQYSAKETLILADSAIIPGLINTHTHAAMSLMRGIADDRALMDWLQNHIWPAEAKWVSEAFVRDGTELAIAEMIQSGTTCFSDMYFFPDITAETCQKHHMRAAVGLILLDFPTVWADCADTYLKKGLEVHQQYQSSDLISTIFAPHAPYTVSDGPMQQLLEQSKKLDIPIHIHLHETTDEIQQSLTEYSKRPIARLNDLGLLSDQLIAVHMCNLEPDEIQLIADKQVHVVHCPESNLKLASGFCPVDALQQAGASVSIGTDGAASNNNLDMFGEMRTAALLAKGVAQNPEALPAFKALEMATLSGAKALGLEQTIGSIKVGKAADLVSINLNDLSSQPIYDPISHIVYACGHHQVEHVWIAGKPVLQQGQLTTLNRDDIIAKAQTWASKMQSS
ncbi:MAG: TRZ/ATZ family hydrolase [Methylococcales bacterium]|jgi:5-methylthioadenosine/S-adenosylhomocysteine deaminase|nr:TRZ/ATZ family hydrolase [Methylococcales bacterium]MBT7444036.1 TRZ/ATZ family hydrolase [Methylococcales bacterium]